MLKLRYRGTKPRLVRLVLLLLIVSLSFTVYRHKEDLRRKVEDWQLDHSNLDDCSAYPDNGDITVVVKTGATEAGRLLPTLLRTSLRCVKAPLIISDLEQEIAGHKLHDVLSGFNGRAADSNADFDIYRLQQQYKREGREKDIPQLAQIPIPQGDWRTSGKSAAWSLDKYKNIRMVDLAWRLQPDRKWYLFIDADTYLVWNNLLHWLATLDHTRSLYIGQPVRMFEHRPPLDFAYGGAGILLSGAAVKRYAALDFVERWDRRIQGWWFGDFMLADALSEELDLHVTDGTPMLGGDNSIDTSYGPHNWCRPVVTMHHLAREDVLALHKIERTAGSSNVTAKDVYHSMPRESLPMMRGDWDNRSEDETFAITLDSTIAEYAHESAAACAAACQTESRCFQYMFTQQAHTPPGGNTKIETQCFLSSIFRQGSQRDPADWREWSGTFRKTWISGWNNVRILSWTTLHGDCGQDANLWRLKPTGNATAT